MNKIWIVIITIGVFLILTILFYKILNRYVTESFGKKWLSLWGNKVYFWQSLVFVSGAGTVLVLILLKWLDVLTF